VRTAVSGRAPVGAAMACHRRDHRRLRRRGDELASARAVRGRRTRTARDDDVRSPGA
jgi:hypothetical protein